MARTMRSVNLKTKCAVEAGLIAIVCVGETLAERESGKAESIVQSQLIKGLDGLTVADTGRIIIAYEPVWAIGTGKTATPEQAQEMHAFIRRTIGEIHGKQVADDMRILYGGSVKPDNIGELMSQEDVDGALVGGASLEATSFEKIVNYQVGQKLEYVLYTIFFLACIVLVAAVLLQPGKTDAGALFTSNVSSASLGPRGTASVLSKLTIAAAIVFMLTALLISMPALSGNISVLSGNAEIPADEQAEQPSVEQQTEPANTNIVTEGNDGALIETPATNSFQADANTATNPAPAANTNPPANK